MTRAPCTERYAGPSFPQLHGAQCELHGPHDGKRHTAMVEGTPVTWWNGAEKEAHRAHLKSGGSRCVGCGASTRAAVLCASCDPDVVAL